MKKETTKKEKVLVISDLQIPFAHKDAYPFLEAVYEHYVPSEVVCIGDEVDFHALSDYEHDPDGFSAGTEMKKALKALYPLYEMFPVVKSCTSNHTARPFRKAYSAGIPRGFLKTYAEFLDAPVGWEWRSNWIIDEVRYEHGHTLGGGAGKTLNANAPARVGRSVVFGHFHTSAGIHYTSTPEALWFGFNVGCLIDAHAYAFNYAKEAKSRPILGCGIVDRGVPTFVPMLVNKSGRWVGELIG